jgi:hypothetical protein
VAGSAVDSSPLVAKTQTVETVDCEMSCHVLEVELVLPAGDDFLLDNSLKHRLTVSVRVLPIELTPAYLIGLSYEATGRPYAKPGLLSPTSII